MATCKFKVGDKVRSGSRRGIVSHVVSKPLIGYVTGKLHPNIQQFFVSIPGYSAPEDYFVHDDVGVKAQPTVATQLGWRKVSRHAAAVRLRRMRKLGRLEILPADAKSPTRIYVMRGNVAEWHVMVKRLDPRVLVTDSMTVAEPVRQDGAPVADNSGGIPIIDRNNGFDPFGTYMPWELKSPLGPKS